MVLCLVKYGDNFTFTLPPEDVGSDVAG